jgi:hypothetical protein
MKGSRSARLEGDLRRKAGRRQQRATIWIVCEGKRTEPSYFQGLLRSLGINPDMARAVPSQYGNDPRSVVRYAEDLLKGDAEVDRIWCVFDRDQHSTFEEAQQRVRAKRSRDADRLRAAASIPCFEFWLLLHLRNATAPFRAAGGGSECEEVQQAIRREMRDYDKADPDIFERFRNGLDDAIGRARRLAADNERTGSRNPATTVHELVLDMRALSATATPTIEPGT